MSMINFLRGQEAAPDIPSPFASRYGNAIHDFALRRLVTTSPGSLSLHQNISTTKRTIPLVGSFTHLEGHHLLAVGDDEGCIRFYDTTDPAASLVIQRSIFLNAESIRDISFSSSDTSLLVVAASGGSRALVNQNSSSPRSTSTTSSTFTTSSTTQVSSSCFLLDVERGVQTAAFNTRSNSSSSSSSSSVSPTACARFMSSSSSSSSGGNEESRGRRHASPPSPQDHEQHILATGTWAGDIQLYDARCNNTSDAIKNSRTIRGAHADVVSGVVFATPLHLLSSGGLDGAVHVWDLRKLPTYSSSSSSDSSSSATNGGATASQVSKRYRISDSASDKGLQTGDMEYSSVDDAARIGGVRGGGGGGGGGILFGPDTTLGTVASIHQPLVTKIVRDAQTQQVLRKGILKSGVSSIDISSQSFHCTGGRRNDTGGQTLLVAHETSRILLYDLSRILCGGGGFYDASSSASVSFEEGYELPTWLNNTSDAWTSAGQLKPNMEDVGIANSSSSSGSGGGGKGGTSTSSSSSSSLGKNKSFTASPERATRPLGTASYITPAKTTVRASRAWSRINNDAGTRILPDSSPSFSTSRGGAAAIGTTTLRKRGSSMTASDTPTPVTTTPSSSSTTTFANPPRRSALFPHIGWTELGGHINPLLFIRARFSRCGNYISSGSVDSRAYIWSLDTAAAARARTRRTRRTRKEGRNDTTRTSLFASSKCSDSDSGGDSEEEEEDNNNDDDDDNVSFWRPSFVLGNHGGFYVNDVVWGGSNGKDGPDERLRIATLSNDSYVRLWSPQQPMRMMRQQQQHSYMARNRRSNSDNALESLSDPHFYSHREGVNQHTLDEDDDDDDDDNNDDDEYSRGRHRNESVQQHRRNSEPSSSTTTTTPFVSASGTTTSPSPSSNSILTADTGRSWQGDIPEVKSDDTLFSTIFFGNNHHTSSSVSSSSPTPSTPTSCIAIPSSLGGFPAAPPEQYVKALLQLQEDSSRGKGGGGEEREQGRTNSFHTNGTNANADALVQAYRNYCSISEREGIDFLANQTQHQQHQQHQQQQTFAMPYKWFTHYSVLDENGKVRNTKHRSSASSASSSTSSTDDARALFLQNRINKPSFQLFFRQEVSSDTSNSDILSTSASASRYLLPPSISPSSTITTTVTSTTPNALSFTPFSTPLHNTSITDADSAESREDIETPPRQGAIEVVGTSATTTTTTSSSSPANENTVRISSGLLTPFPTREVSEGVKSSLPSSGAGGSSKTILSRQILSKKKATISSSNSDGSDKSIWLSFLGRLTAGDLPPA